jgi:hypothetical protein
LRTRRLEQLHVRLLEERHERHPRHEAADMREEGDAAFARGRQHAANDLHQEPDAERDKRRHMHDRDEHAEENQRAHGGVRMQQHIGAEHTGDGAARAHHGNGRARVDRALHHGRSDPAQEIEDEVARVAHGVLDIVAEDPEEQHVHPEMHEAAMHEHRGEHGGPARYDRERRNHLAVTEQPCGYHPELHDRRLAAIVAKRKLPKKDENAGPDQRPGDDRLDLARIVVGDRKHGRSGFARRGAGRA